MFPREDLNAVIISLQQEVTALRKQLRDVGVKPRHNVALFKPTLIKG